MLTELNAILLFIWENLLNIWPYLLVTIPIAVAVNLSGVSRYINHAFQARPLVAIFLATAVGAFSPFCSCSVIPVIAALLIGGVPLGPVMSFWIASPAMDPEIFFLSVSQLGWSLAVWRLVATFALSLAAGLLTHLLMERGWLARPVLRDHYNTEARTLRQLLTAGAQKLRAWLFPPQSVALGFAALQPVPAVAPAGSANCGSDCAPAACDDDCAPAACGDGLCAIQPPPSFTRRLLNETWAATLLVVKFMLLAFFLEALVVFYIPSEWIAGLLGSQNPLAVPTAALLGVPMYTSNLAALPLVSGLLAQGMNPAAALTFLIAGPTTTLPAMAAVWGLVRRKVFALYVLLSLVGAIAAGALYSLILSI